MVGGSMSAMGRSKLEDYVAIKVMLTTGQGLKAKVLSTT